MRIKFNKKYIEDYQMARVKEDAKQFAEANTLNDLRREFEDQVGIYLGCNPEILKAEITAMDSGWATGNKTIFNVEMVVDGYSSMFRIQFYIDMNMEIDTRDLVTFDGKDHGKLYTVTEYKMA